jgi:hypothetical protein
MREPGRPVRELRKASLCEWRLFSLPQESANCSPFSRVREKVRMRVAYLR